MRHYDNATEALREILRDIQERGVWLHSGRMQDKETSGNDAFMTKELLNYSFALIDVSNLDKLAQDLKCNLDWCKAEFQERISSAEINPGFSWLHRKDVWQEYLGKHDGKFAYTYNERIRKQICNVICELIKHPYTRQAIVSIYDLENDTNKIGNDRIPCSMYYQFLFRDDKLHIIYNIRSSDYNLHFRNDIYLACALLNYIANKCNMKVGNLFMNIGSAHIYKKDWDGSTF